MINGMLYLVRLGAYIILSAAFFTTVSDTISVTVLAR